MLFILGLTPTQRAVCKLRLLGIILGVGSTTAFRELHTNSNGILGISDLTVCARSHPELPLLLAKKSSYPDSPLAVGMFNLGCSAGNDRDENKSSSKVGDLLRVQYFDLLSVLLCFF